MSANNYYGFNHAGTQYGLVIQVVQSIFFKDQILLWDNFLTSNLIIGIMNF